MGSKRDSTADTPDYSWRRTQNDNDILRIYLSEITDVPLLSRSQERECLEKAKSGDTVARDQLIESNLKCVVRVARRYQGCGLPLEDLINEGNIGLMKSIEKYDLSKRHHFITYAVWWIRHSIHKAIADKSRTIRIPSNKGTALFRLQTVCESRENPFILHSEQTIREIAGELHTTSAAVKELIMLTRVSNSYDDIIDSDKNMTVLRNCMYDEDAETPEDAASLTMLSGEINNALRILTKKESEILQDRYGLNGRLPLTLADIGRKYHVTRERIRQIELKAIQKLKNWGGNFRLRSYQL